MNRLTEALESLEAYETIAPLDKVQEWSSAEADGRILTDEQIEAVRIILGVAICLNKSVFDEPLENICLSQCPLLADDNVSCHFPSNSELIYAVRLLTSAWKAM